MAASEENIKRFMMAQDKAKKLIQMDVNGGFKKYSQKAREAAEICMNENTTPQYNMQPTQTPSNTNSKLPKEILESFKTKQIDTAPLGYGVSSSILDEVNYRTQGKLYNEEKPITEKPKQQIVETSNNILPSSSNIDYSMIKMIVEECMRKYTNTLKKTLLNESKSNANDELKAMKIGDKFSFITKNGDLYEAELKFIKNINKKG
jgi:hypothetical protein